MKYIRPKHIPLMMSIFLTLSFGIALTTPNNASAYTMQAYCWNVPLAANHYCYDGWWALIDNSVGDASPTNAFIVCAGALDAGLQQWVSDACAAGSADHTYSGSNALYAKAGAGPHGVSVQGIAWYAPLSPAVSPRDTKQDQPIIEHASKAQQRAFSVLTSGAPPPPAIQRAIDPAGSLASRAGANLNLARSLTTPITGSKSWLIPASGKLCLAVPDPVDGFGVTCASDAAATSGQLVLSLRNGPTQIRNEAITVQVVPDDTSEIAKAVVVDLADPVASRNVISGTTVGAP